MKYRLFISDFDGTLVRRDGTVSIRNREAIAKYTSAGGIFAVCTGRMPCSILPRVRELGLSGPVIAYQGAVAVDIATGEILRAERFSYAEAFAVLRVLEELKEHIHLYTLDTLYCNRADEMLRYYEQVCRVKANVLEEPLSAFVEREKPFVVKLLAMVEPEKREALYRKLRSELDERFYITASARELLEIMPVGQSKAAGVDFLSQYYGIPLSETAAIGDQDNDLPMLDRAGGKFMVANAMEEYRKCAVTVPSNEEDGVAYALEKYAMVVEE